MIVSVSSTGQCRSGQVPQKKAADGYPSQQSKVGSSQLRPNWPFMLHICCIFAFFFILTALQSIHLYQCQNLLHLFVASFLV